jgi:hypothetical protein
MKAEAVKIKYEAMHDSSSYLVKTESKSCFIYLKHENSSQLTELAFENSSQLTACGREHLKAGQTMQIARSKLEFYNSKSVPHCRISTYNVQA